MLPRREYACTLIYSVSNHIRFGFFIVAFFMHLDIFNDIFMCRYVLKAMNLEMLKRLIICDASIWLQGRGFYPWCRSS